VNAETFRTAWFMESMATQILVIFIIRTLSNPWASTPHPLLLGTSLGALCVALIIALGPWGQLFSFHPPGATIVLAVTAIVAAYLLAAHLAKKFTYRR